ncbi:DNA repair protein Nse1 [Trichophyton tonsurans CBS 112818]|uniref:Non-structural maintenance of chromosomes element 1 homolog n=3 Tax=Trichophyton TaxID=5550 RepID=A0A059IXE6_TRIIM|nr:DNA repair protein Nse1 [Trichophyton tonsurans CBS 112818]EGE05109.1 DNA repair protein Nse1 [Trichophyton equinum CBS 127.97]EZF30743.1 hypothetical protein H101_05627 [Trichophyton interdigitale H6]KDB20280.1 hypothetical protein H109_07761 [Trichophyton interdigitale MR816]
MADDGYNHSHRAFLQAFMSRSTMTLEEAKPVLAAIFTVSEGREILPGDITQTDLNTYIAAINTAISAFDLEIRGTAHQTQQSRVYALINTTSDPMMQLATTYSADEIAYVKRLLDAMFESNNTSRCEAMVVSSIEAVRLARTGSNLNRRQSEGVPQSGTAQPLSMREAEGMLSRLVAEGWLERSQAGYYSLSPRALMELRGWLVETYNEEEDEDGGTHRNNRIKTCFACKEIITVGQRCSTRQCSGRLHQNCIRNFFRLQQAEVCPVCKTRWTGDCFVGERALTGQPPRGRSRATGRAAETED